MKKLLTAMFAFVFLLATVTGGTAQSAPLENAGFEDGFRHVDGVGELQVAEDWHPWWMEGPQHRPEYKPETRQTGSARVRTGDFAQKHFTTFSTQDGGIRQSVKVEPGKWYEFSAWAYVWCSGESNPDESVGGKCSALVGINPWGDWNATYRTTVWGKEELNVYNQWVRVTVTAQAWNDEIALFTRGVSEYPVKHNDFYWDDASFREVTMGTGPCPTPEPCPAGTPAPGNCPSLEDIDGAVRDALRDLELTLK